MASKLQRIFLSSREIGRVVGNVSSRDILFEVLDGTETADYVQRVEPSPQGGAKMARALMDAVVGTTASAAGSPWEEMGEVTPSPPPSPLTPLSSTSASPLLCAPTSCAVSRG